MKRRVLSLLLALVAVLSLGAPAMAEPAPEPVETAAPVEELPAEPVETAVPTLEPTEAPMETVVPTAEPTVEPVETAIPTSEPTVEPEQTAVPTAEPSVEPEQTEAPQETPEPTLDPDATPDPDQTPDPNATPDPNGIMPIAEAGTITLNRSEITAKSARTVILRATFEPYPTAGQQVKWTSSDPSVIEFESSNEQLRSSPYRGDSLSWGLAPQRSPSPARDMRTPCARWR